MNFLNYFVFIALTTIAQECFSFKDMRKCISLVPCFWITTRQECHEMSQWMRIEVGPRGKLNECNRMRNVQDCYTRSHCFWIAPKGKCENIGQWIPKVLDLPCKEWRTSKDCWAVQKCEWWATNECLEGPDYRTSTSTTTPLSSTLVASPTRLPKKLPCTYASTFNECELSNGCVWSFQKRDCFSMDSKCSWLRSRSECEINEDCHWLHQNQTCDSNCRYRTSRDGCTLDRNCAWNLRQNKCSSTQQVCHSIQLKNDCRNVGYCHWSEFGPHEGCHSYYSSCEKMQTFRQCRLSQQLSTHCRWSVGSNKCISSNITRRVHQCSDIRNSVACLLSSNHTKESSTRHLYCIWVNSKCEDVNKVGNNPTQDYDSRQDVTDNHLPPVAEKSWFAFFIFLCGICLGVIGSSMGTYSRIHPMFQDSVEPVSLSWEDVDNYYEEYYYPR